MFRSSLRSWLLFVAVLFSGLVVGGMALTTYVVVSDGMSTVARDSTFRVAVGASDIVRSHVTDALLEASRSASSPEERDAEARRLLLRAIPEMLAAGSLSDGEFALYGQDLELLWRSGDRALVSEAQLGRQRALGSPGVIEERLGQSGFFRGLVGPSDLGVFVVHVPFDMPDGESALLDVVYLPRREEAVIDAIRSPMAALAIAAVFIMVVMMQTSMTWVLKLVDDLRRAADSIAAGRLDVRLPIEGEHEIGDLARSLNALIDRLRLTYRPTHTED
ncbi:HAMP domain-containing protein, partial [bacterium]|nr:HAMP domain-containing protein [bacterium]